jgi:hypothetical protein
VGQEEVQVKEGEKKRSGLVRVWIKKSDAVAALTFSKSLGFFFSLICLVRNDERAAKERQEKTRELRNR